MQNVQIRTTIYLTEPLYKAAKKKAIEEGTTMTSLIVEGLRQRIIQRGREIKDPFVQLRHKYPAPLKGVDIVREIRKNRKRKTWTT